MQKKLVKLNGGLGNQMFQCAFAYVLAKKSNSQVLFDFSYFEEVPDDKNVVIRPFELNFFNTDCKKASGDDLKKVVHADNRSIISKILWKIFKIGKCKPRKNIITQKKAYEFDKKLFNNLDYYYYDGYFQNEKYFKDYRDEILKLFSLNETLDEKNQAILDNILQTNSVSIHVRRGDYVTLKSANDFHGVCTLDYYKKAIKYISKRIKNPHFFLFSDDIGWVMDNLKTDYPFTVIDFNPLKGWMDMNLMKNCKHNITANSSFSWWSAWLNDNPDKIVIAPEKWILQKSKCNIIPKNWVKM